MSTKQTRRFTVGRKPVVQAKVTCDVEWVDGPDKEVVVETEGGNFQVRRVRPLFTPWAQKIVITEVAAGRSGSQTVTGSFVGGNVTQITGVSGSVRLGGWETPAAEVVRKVRITAPVNRVEKGW